LEDKAAAGQDAARMVALWTNATDGAENQLLRFNTYPENSAAGYFGFWCGNDIDDTQETVIPNGAGDVTGYFWVRYLVVESGGGVNAATTKLEPGDAAATLYDDGTDVLQLTVGVGGQVTIVRTAGAATFDVALLMLWI